MKDLILSVFQARAYPELAAAVRANIAQVVDRWIQHRQEGTARAAPATAAN